MRPELRMVATADFTKAKSRARSSRIRSLLTGRNDDLPSLDAAKESVGSMSECYAGCDSIPVDHIVGSEGRSPDFNRAFLPRREFMRHRWQNIDAAYYAGTPLPAVKVVKIGDSYYVRDGNHRVSVARMHKIAYIDAEVTRLYAAHAEA